MTQKDPGKPIKQMLASALEPTPLDRYPPPLQPLLAAVLARADKARQDEFKGITTESEPRSGLFPICRTGVSTAPIAAAAHAFIQALSPEQRQVVQLPIDSHDWRTWNNMHFFLYRHGVLLDELSDAQRATALELVRATLSTSGFKGARDVMKLNEHIAELTQRTEEYSEWYYWMSVFGTPSPTEPWGWQIDGHHLIINCFVLGDQLVLTPDFQGSEPVHAESGKYAGTRVFHDEESRGLKLMQSLTAPQRQQAVIGSTVPRELTTIAHVDNAQMPYAGIRHDALNPAQQSLLVELIATYTQRLRPGHAEIRLKEVQAYLGETYFGWMGQVDDHSPFYYRIQSPVILIEFDHLPGIAYDNKEPTRRHIHTIVRTPNGNDYGRDLLRQHYEQHDHSHPHSPHRSGRE